MTKKLDAEIARAIAEGATHAPIPVGARLMSLRKAHLVDAFHKEPTEFHPSGQRYFKLNQRGMQHFADLANKAEKIAARDAHCQICERAQAMSAKGTMVLHGYERPGWGFVLGRCYGVGYLPWEVSCDRLGEWIDQLRNILQSNQRLLAEIPGRKIELIEDPAERMKRMLSHDKKFKKSPVPLIEIDATHAQFAKVKARHLSDISSQCERLATEITRQSRRLASWKPTR